MLYVLNLSLRSIINQTTTKCSTSDITGGSVRLTMVCCISGAWCHRFISESVAICSVLFLISFHCLIDAQTNTSHMLFDCDPDKLPAPFWYPGMLLLICLLNYSVTSTGGSVQMSQEALAGLASRENFSRVTLRKADSFNARRYLPYSNLMLLQFKGNTSQSSSDLTCMTMCIQH